MGLVDAVTAPEKVLGEAIRVAQAMARHDREALAAAKAALHAATALGYEEGLQREVELFLALHARPESRRRIAQFLETK